MVLFLFYRYSLNGADREWLGSTYSNKSYITNLDVHGEHGCITFTVQPQYKSGIIQDINKAGTYSFKY